MSQFNGLGMGLGNLARLSAAHTRSISAENVTGAKGQGGRATEGTGAGAARDLGRGWKVSPSIDIAEPQRLGNLHRRAPEHRRHRVADLVRPAFAFPERWPITEVFAAPEVLGVDQMHEREGDRQHPRPFMVVDLFESQIGDSLLP